MVVINITEQSNIRCLNGSCASNSLTLVFLNFLCFYPPRSFESLYDSFPILLKFILGLACGNSHGYRPFSKIPQYSRKAYCILIPKSVLSSICQVLIKSAFFFLNASNSSVSQIWVLFFSMCCDKRPNCFNGSYWLFLLQKEIILLDFT